MNADGVKVNPEGSERGVYYCRVFRGGSFLSYANGCRVVGRDWDTPGNRYDVLGLRLALSVPARRSRDEGQS